MISAEASDLKELAQRLGSAVEKAGGRKAVSKEANVPLSTLDRYLAAKSEAPSLTLARIARACSVSVDQLVGADLVFARDNARSMILMQAKTASPQFSDMMALGDDYVSVPRFDVRASAGNGRIADSEPALKSEIVFRTTWLRSLGVVPDFAEFLEADGDSMLETIHHGDLLLINRQIDRVVNNAIYVVVLAGAVMVKRLQLLFDGSIMLISDNPRYQPERVDKTDVEGLQVEGRVRWYGRAI